MPQLTGTEHRLIARIACTVMLKDEVNLTEPFLRYLAPLAGR